MVGPRLKLLIVVALAAIALAQLPIGSAAPPEPVPPAAEAIFLPPLPVSPDVDDPPKPEEPKSTNPSTTQTTPPTATPPNSAVGNLLNQPAQSSQSGPNAPPPMTTQPMVANADVPISQESSLFGQLSKAQERASQSAAPSATGVDAVGQGSASAIETTELVRESTGAISIARARRSAVSMQPVIRGYQQSQIYAQYQGANFVPARIDFDSILSNIDPGVINNLIIIPGPYGVKYGPGLSFIDIVATPTPRYAIPEFHSQTNVLAQSNGQQLYGREMFFGGGPDYGFRFSVGQKTGNDYRSGDNTSIPASYNVRDIDLAVGFDLSPLAKLELEYLTQDMTNTEFAGLIFDARFRKTDALSVRLTIDDLEGPNWLVEAWFNRTSYSGDNLNPSKQFFYRNTYPFNSPIPFPNPYPHVSFTGFTTGETTNAGFRLAPTWGKKDEVQITAGIDFHYVAQQIDEVDKFEDPSIGITPGKFDSFPVPPAKSYDPGVYWEMKAPVEDDVTITAGARIDLVTSSADGRHRTVAPDGTIPNIVAIDDVAPGNFLVKNSYEEILGGTFDRRNLLLAGFISAEYRVTEELHLRAGFGHGERAPNATERYGYLPFLTIIQTPSNAPAGDPNLRSEKSNQFDLALIGDYEDVRFQISGFASIIHDYISFANYPFPNALNFPEILHYANTNATLAGGEASGEYDVTENWSPFFNLSFVEGRDQTRHEPLPSIFPFQSRMGLRWHDPSRKQYGVELSARVVAAQYHVSTRLSEPRTPGFTTFDLRGYWQFNKHLKLNGGIENLTNLNYLEALSVHNPAVFEPGTNFFLGAQVDY